MAANFIQEEELFNGSEQEEVQDVTTPVPDSTGAGNTEVVDTSEPVEELPEKYRGKSAIRTTHQYQAACAECRSLANDEPNEA